MKTGQSYHGQLSLENGYETARADPVTEERWKLRLPLGDSLDEAIYQHDFLFFFEWLNRVEVL
jgi:hypothetical protein